MRRRLRRQRSRSRWLNRARRSPRSRLRRTQKANASNPPRRSKRLHFKRRLLRPLLHSHNQSRRRRLWLNHKHNHKSRHPHREIRSWHSRLSRTLNHNGLRRQVPNRSRASCSQRLLRIWQTRGAHRRQRLVLVRRCVTGASRRPSLHVRCQGVSALSPRPVRSMRNSRANLHPCGLTTRRRRCDLRYWRSLPRRAPQHPKQVGAIDTTRSAR
jgi:hypothetical protein